MKQERKKIAMPKYQEMEQIETLSCDEVKLQLLNFSRQYHRIYPAYNERNEQLGKIHNRIKEQWKFLYYTSPDVARKVAEEVEVSFEDETHFPHLNDTERVLQAITQSIRHLPQLEDVSEEVQTLKREKEELLHQLKQAKELAEHRGKKILELEEKSKRFVSADPKKITEIKVVGKGITLKPKPINIVEEGTKEEEPVVKETVVEVIEKEADVFVEKVENLEIYTLLEQYNPSPAVDPIYDCEIEYEGKKASVYCLNGRNTPSREHFEDMIKMTDRICFIGDNRKEFNQYIASDFVMWLIGQGKNNQIGYSFTTKQKLRSTKELNEFIIS